MRLSLVLPILLCLASPAAASGVVMPPLTGLPAAIAARDMRALIPEIVAVFEQAGITWDPAIEWQVGPYTTSFWYYDHNEHQIVVGAVPSADEVVDYWQNWSRVLTDGQWQPALFFADASEAAELAAYNQFVLATHEAAHAETYRYDYGHLARHDYAVNCREFYADRLTAGIMAAAAAQNADMARWRLRYRDLVATMAETIPPRYRVHIASFAALDADCGLIEVAQPTPDTMQPYASAYFERWRVLLDASLPPLDEIFRVHLADRFAASMAEFPRSRDGDGYHVSTLGRVDPDADADVETPLGETRSTAIAFGPDGTLYRASFRYVRAGGAAELSFGAGMPANVPLGPLAPWPHPSVRAEVTSMVVFGPERFLASIVDFELSADDTARFFVSWLLAERQDGRWTVKAIRETPEAKQGVALRAPSGGLFLLETPDPESKFHPSTRWQMLELDPASFTELASTPILAPLALPLAVDDRRRVFTAGLEMLWRSAVTGDEEIFAGTGLSGPRDGDAQTMEFNSIEALQWLGDDALLVDRTPRGEALIRRLHLLPDFR